MLYVQTLHALWPCATVPLVKRPISLSVLSTRFLFFFYRHNSARCAREQYIYVLVSPSYKRTIHPCLSPCSTLFHLYVLWGDCIGIWISTDSKEMKTKIYIYVCWWAASLYWHRCLLMYTNISSCICERVLWNKRKMSRVTGKKATTTTTAKNLNCTH